MKQIPIAGPWITDKEIDYVADAAKNAWYGDASIYHERFEKAFADYIGVSFAISLPSCTSALHLSLLSLGVGPGDEVIVPDLTWIASSAPISYVGATPVFADVDKDSWCLSADSFEASITPKTKAVIVVDLYGSMPDMDAIRRVADKHDVAVIEDAAEAIGSLYKGKKAGSFGDTGTFSFHGSKTLTTGEGGMLVTDNKDIKDRVLFLRDHGRRPGDTSFVNTEVAFKYKMSSMQAAMGLAQIERVEELVAKKREIFGWYKESLAGIGGFTLNSEPPDTRNSYWMVTVVLDEGLGIPKEKLMARLLERDVDSRPFFSPLSSLPAYEELKDVDLARARNAVSYGISPYGVNLPSALCLTRDDVELVSLALRGSLRI